jgi:hypothetical protein
MLRSGAPLPNYRVSGRIGWLYWDGVQMGLAEVSDILWRERELLDVLLFKLEEEQLLLASGRMRWLSRATREVELVLEQIRLTEITRAMEVEALAGELGLGPNPSLAALCEKAPDPWGALFAAHREAFLAATKEITALAESNREIVSSSFHATREALLSFGDVDAVEGYNARGRRAESAPRQRILDEVI